MFVKKAIYIHDVADAVFHQRQGSVVTLHSAINKGTFRSRWRFVVDTLRDLQSNELMQLIWIIYLMLTL